MNIDFVVPENIIWYLQAPSRDGSEVWINLCDGQLHFEVTYFGEMGVEISICDRHDCHIRTNDPLEPEVALRFTPELQEELGLYVTVPEDCVLVTQEGVEWPVLYDAGTKVLWAVAHNATVLAHHEFTFVVVNNTYLIRVFCESGKGKQQSASQWSYYPSEKSLDRRKRKLENKGWSYRDLKAETAAR